MDEWLWKIRHPKGNKRSYIFISYLTNKQTFIIQISKEKIDKTKLLNI
jgi:hypothetical protein